MLPAAGALGALLAGSSHAWAANTATVTSTTATGALTASTRDNGSAVPASIGTPVSCPFTNNPADPNEVAYAVPGRHAGKHALVAATTPASGSATSTYVDVRPVAPAPTGLTVPSNNRAPGWTISSVDPAGFPLLLLVIVGFFLMVQSWVDRRDPKLALASVAADADLQFAPPPSRGDA